MSGLRSCLPLVDFDPAVGIYDSNDVLVSLQNTGIAPIPFIVVRPASAGANEGYLRRYVKGNPAWQFVTNNIGSSLAFDLRPGNGQPQAANPAAADLMSQLWNGDRGISTFAVATEYDSTITNQRYIYSGWPQSAGFTFPLSSFSTPTSKAVLGMPVAGIRATIQHPAFTSEAIYILSGSFSTNFHGNTFTYTIDAEYCNTIGFAAQSAFSQVFLATQVDRPVGLLIGGNFGSNINTNAYPGLILRILITPWLDKTKRLQVVEELKQIYF